METIFFKIFFIYMFLNFRVRPITSVKEYEKWDMEVCDLLLGDKEDIRLENVRNLQPVFHFNKRLLNSLNSIFKTPITIISAPIGYGKTTAIREFLYRTNAAILWTNIFSNSAEDFWKSFCQAMFTCNDMISSKLTEIGFPQDENALLQSVNLVGEIGFQQETALVIDDYHLIKGDAVTSFILALAKKTIPRFHIIISSRESFPYDDELLLGGYVNPITAGVFALDKTDIERYFEKYSLTLTDSEIGTIAKYTEGWISALHLIALEALHHFPAQNSVMGTVDDSGLLSSILKLVYQPLPVQCKQFLCCMCCLPDFSMEQAEYIWPEPSKGISAGRLLETLISKNAFILYDEPKGCYHIHTLFCKVLQMNFDRLSQELRNQYMKQMGDWYMLQKDHSRAIRYYCRAEFFDGVYESLSKSSVAYYTNDDIPMLIRGYLSHRPESTAIHLKGMLTLAGKMYLNNEYAVCYEILSDFDKLLKTDRQLGETDRNILRAEFEIFCSFSDGGGLDAVEIHLDHADELCPEDGKITHRLDWTFGCPSLLLLYYRKSGTLSGFSEEFLHALKKYERLTDYDPTGMVYLLRAEIQFYRCQFEEAEIMLYCALRLAKRNHEYSLWIACCFLKARILLFRGNLREAFEIFRKANEIVRQNNLPGLLKTIDLCEGWLYLILGQSENVAKWLRDLEAAEEITPRQSLPAVNLVNGLWLLSNQYDTEYISYSIEKSNRGDETPGVLSVVYQKLCLSVAYRNIGRMDDATACFTQAVAFAQADELYLPFAELSMWLTDMMDTAVETQYAEFLKAVKEKTRRIKYTLSPALLQDSIQSGNVLSKREGEIVSLVQSGSKNREIADELYISENTVKSALKVIFRKLGISSRKELQIRQNSPEKPPTIPPLKPLF